jgi:hypothetical protein
MAVPDLYEYQIEFLRHFNERRDMEPLQQMQSEPLVPFPSGTVTESNTIGAPVPPLQVMRSFTRGELGAIQEHLNNYIDRAFDEYPEDFEDGEDVNLDAREDNFDYIFHSLRASEKISHMLNS